MDRRLGRKLVVLDADSTLIDNEVIELLADEAGSGALVAEITDRAMRGELDFAASLRERVATLGGLTPEAIARVRAKVSVTEGVPELIAAVQAEDGWVCVVSGGFHEVLDPVAQALGVNAWRANRLETAPDGSLSGQVSGHIVDATAKAKALLDWASEGDFLREDTVAIGDGANDLDMMSVAGLSVAFCAKPIVRDRAHVAIDVRDMRHAIDMIRNSART
ncbi:MAG: phosphoserine phosphatase SerB [Aurantimicrobium sp.]|nr:phosphoserine phosphatase SerB [Aurantimicrobium sp.]